MHLVTDKSLENLRLGRIKGLTKKGHINSIKEKEKRSKSLKKFYKEHPDVAQKRGLLLRADKHYLWKGGISNLNQSIRQLNEYRNWQRKMKKRDKICVVCGTSENLEAHHIIPIKILIEKHKIKNRDDARKCKELWTIKNGITLCIKCHYKLHKRKYANG